jgi:hypothetical protein
MARSSLFRTDTVTALPESGISIIFHMKPNGDTHVTCSVALPTRGNKMSATNSRLIELFSVNPAILPTKNSAVTPVMIVTTRSRRIAKRTVSFGSSSSSPDAWEVLEDEVDLLNRLRRRVDGLLVAVLPLFVLSVPRCVSSVSLDERLVNIDETRNTLCPTGGKIPSSAGMNVTAACRRPASTAKKEEIMLGNAIDPRK